MKQIRLHGYASSTISCQAPPICLLRPRFLHHLRAITRSSQKFPIDPTRLVRVVSRFVTRIAATLTPFDPTRLVRVVKRLQCHRQICDVCIYHFVVATTATSTPTVTECRPPPRFT